MKEREQRVERTGGVLFRNNNTNKKQKKLTFLKIHIWIKFSKIFQTSINSSNLAVFDCASVAVEFSRLLLSLHSQIPLHTVVVTVWFHLIVFDRPILVGFVTLVQILILFTKSMMPKWLTKMLVGTMHNHIP